MRRIVVVGSSGSGKTTVALELAERLGIPHLELDSVAHREGWESLRGERFRSEVAAFASDERWVADGNYTSWGVADVLWPRADTFVWLDLPRWRVMSGVIGRTLRRVVTRERLWEGELTEPWTNLYSLDPEKNIIVWAWTKFDHTRSRYERATSDGTWAHGTVHRIASRSQLRSLLDSLLTDH